MNHRRAATAILPSRWDQLGRSEVPPPADAELPPLPTSVPAVVSTSPDAQASERESRSELWYG